MPNPFVLITAFACGPPQEVETTANTASEPSSAPVGTSVLWVRSARAEGHPELYSGRHHTTGLNLQVVRDLASRMRWISDPVEDVRGLRYLAMCGDTRGSPSSLRRICKRVDRVE